MVEVDGKSVKPPDAKKRKLEQSVKPPMGEVF